MDDKRSRLIDLFDRARVNGVAYLFVIAALGSVTRPELADVTGENEDTLGKYLLRMESRGLCVRVRDGKADRWHLHPTAAATLQLHAADHLLPKISATNPSSSSDLLDQSVFDQSDQSEEEEDDCEFKTWLCSYYGLTGDKARAVVADSVSAEDVVAWMCQVHAMKLDGFKFKKSAEAYAIHCLLRHDAPNAHSVHLMSIEIDHLWSEFSKHAAYVDGAAPDDDDPPTPEQIAADQRQAAIVVAYVEIQRLSKVIESTFGDRTDLLKQREVAHRQWLALIEEEKHDAR